jgi:hypothetical protein
VIGLQEQVTNHRKRLGSKAPVVSVAEKVPEGIRCGSRRRTTVNCRSSVEMIRRRQNREEMLARDKRGGCLFTGHAASGIEAARSRFGLSRRTAGTFGCDAKGKAQALKREADSTDAQPRGGATRSSEEVAVMAAERRGRIIVSRRHVNRASGRSVEA